MARELKANADMMKEKLHLGQVLTYDGRRAVVDALTQSSVGLLIGGNYEVVDWESLTLLVSRVGA